MNKLTKEKIGFILYNNRSEELVNRFLSKDINILKIIKIENALNTIKNKYIIDKWVEVDSSEINFQFDDILFNPEDVSSLTEIFNERSGRFSDNEAKFLTDRGISIEVANKYKIFGLSQITDRRHQDIIGATVHPMLNKVLDDDIDSGGIIIPIFNRYSILENCLVRKISIENNPGKKSIKYSISIPDISIWGIDDIELGDEIWISEGIFDAMSLREIGLKSISTSSAMILNALQIIKIIDKVPKFINIFSDNDSVGIRSSNILSELFDSFNIKNKIWISKIAKDPSDHFFKYLGSLEDITDTIPNYDEIFDNSFNFIDHMKKRKY